jgi:hypothetical protein
MRDIERTVHTMQDEATVFADPNDRASQETDIAIELRNRDRERKLIKKIEDTIALIESGDYGYCTAVVSRSASSAWKHARRRRFASTARRSKKFANGKSPNNDLFQSYQIAPIITGAGQQKRTPQRPFLLPTGIKITAPASAAAAGAAATPPSSGSRLHRQTNTALLVGFQHLDAYLSGLP